MARRKTISISLTRLIQLGVVINSITGKTLRQIIEEMLSGNISDNMIALALETLNRIEADGISIVVDIGIKTFVMELIRRSVGRKQVLKIGMLRVTL
jgi:ACT domain-containing protein